MDNTVDARARAVTDEHLALWPAFRQVEAIRTRELSARELVGVYAARIERFNQAINAVVALDLEQALDHARAIDERIAHGDPVGILAGLPMTIKDAIEVAGMPCTAGAVEMRDHVPKRDAPVVTALRAAGAVVLGKTNLPAWCAANTETNNELFGTTNNPWDLRRSVGGSSGGSAAAVAAGLSSCDIGSDIGGSIRMPSHYCGVYGLKPSYGIVTQLGFVSYADGGRTEVDLNHLGPIARSPDDLELLLNVLARPTTDDALAWTVNLPEPRHARIDGYRIGAWFDEPYGAIESEYRTILSETVDALRREGAQVDESHPNVAFKDQTDLWFALVAAASAPNFPDDMADTVGGSHLQWLRDRERRQELRRRWHEWFDDHDALLCPVVFSAAPEHNLDGNFLDRTIDIDGVARSLVFDVPRWCGLLNVIGFPSCVVPIGRTAAGLPVGVQIVTPYLRDRDGIQLARCMEAVVGGFTAPPMA
jgi:amidase